MSNALTLTNHSPYRWALLAVVVAGQVAACAFYLSWAALTPFLRADFGLTLEQVGLIVGAVAAGAAVASAPLGRISDRLGSRTVLIGGMFAMAALSVLATLSPSFPILFVAVAAAGIAFGAVNPAGVSVLVPWFPRRELGTAMAFKEIGFPLGGALAAAILPALTLALGTWRLPVALVGVLIGVLAIAGLAVVRDRPAAERRRGVPAGHWWTAILCRNVLLLGLTGLLYAALLSAWFGHLVLYAQQDLRMPVTAGAGLLALTQFSAVPGRILVGLVSDRLLGGRRRALLVYCGLVGALAVGVLPLLSTSPIWLVGALGVVFGLSLGSYTPPQFAALAREGEERSSGAVVGFGLGCNSAGILVGPTLFGRAVDTLGVYGPAWTGLALAGLLGALAALAIRERVDSGR